MMDPQLDREIRLLGVVVAAMIMGLLGFGAVVLVIGPSMDPPDPELGRILMIALGALAVIDVLAYTVLHKALMANARRRFKRESSDEDAEARILPTWRVVTLLRSAMAEGLGMFGLVILFITGEQAALAAPVLALVVLLAGFPTRDKLVRLTASFTGRNPFSR